MNPWIRKYLNMTEGLTDQSYASFYITFLVTFSKTVYCSFTGWLKLKLSSIEHFEVGFLNYRNKSFSVVFSFVSVTICGSIYISVMVYSKICQIRNRFLNISQLSFYVFDSLVLPIYHWICVSGLETAPLK